jgi:hypothetical protein
MTNSNPLGRERRKTAANPKEPVAGELKPSPDPNDLEALAAPRPLAAAKTLVTKVRASTKPPKGKFIRILPFTIGTFGDLDSYENCYPVYLFEHEPEDKRGTQSYYVQPDTEVASLLDQHGLLKQAILVVGITRARSVFVWELKLPDGRNDLADQWAESRLEVAKSAMQFWVRPKADMSAGGYLEDRPIADYPDPDWSKVDFTDLVKVACKGRVITSTSHESVKDALGL